MCLQPATTAGRAETRSPGLLLLSSPGSQKALEPLCQRRSGRGIRKNVAAPKTRKQKGTTRERQRGNQQASGRPKPETPENRRTTAERDRRKSKTQSAGHKTQTDFNWPRQNLRDKSGTEKQTEEDVPSERAKNQPCPV